MKITFTEAAWEDYLWLQDNDKKLLKRVNLLIKDIFRNSTEGIGKPELLKANLSGYWSRRITSEHRLIYSVTFDEITIIACRFHYIL
jgi:toxin YoeB